jgi:hypothetical protein
MYPVLPVPSNVCIPGERITPLILQRVEDRRKKAN